MRDRPDHDLPHPTVMPEGCVCDPQPWFQTAVTPICASYEEDSNYPGCCANCEHMLGCHQTSSDEDALQRK